MVLTAIKEVHTVYETQGNFSTEGVLCGTIDTAGVFNSVLVCESNLILVYCHPCSPQDVQYSNKVMLF